MPRSHKALPSTSCDLCACKVWNCYGQWLRRCITKKIHSLTLTPRSRGSRSHKMLLSTLSFMWPMHQQSLMSLHPMVKEKMHLQENTLFDLDPKVKGVKVNKMLPSTPNFMWPMYQQSLILLHPTIKEKMHLQVNSLFDLDLWTKCCTVTSTSCDLCTHRVWSYCVKRFRKKNIYKKIQYSICCPVPSTSYKLSSYKVWSCYV